MAMRTLCILVLAFVATLPEVASAQAFAPGFHALPKGAKVALMPSDIELYSISAGGIPEPKADWTEAAQRNFKQAMMKKKDALGISVVEAPGAAMDELTEFNAVETAVARAIVVHYLGPSHLPTKGGNLDWSLGDAAQVAKKATGADYALYTWIRDSYASAERQAAIVAMALLGVGIPGGQQAAYASLIDLNTGRVLWFNRIQRGTGDLRDPDKAQETLDVLLDKFPAAK
jgi:hypothetical protein